VQRELSEVLKQVHATLAMALAAVVVVHVAGAVKHHWIDRDGLLQRMLPARQ
jgi:cytochrome b561